MQHLIYWPCRITGNDVSQCDASQAEFFGVYRILPDGMKEWVSDVPDEETAKAFICQQAGWKRGGGYVFNTSVYGSWKEAVSQTGEDGTGSPVYDTWADCYAAEVEPRA